MQIYNFTQATTFPNDIQLIGQEKKKPDRANYCVGTTDERIAEHISSKEIYCKDIYVKGGRRHCTAGDTLFIIHTILLGLSVVLQDLAVHASASSMTVSARALHVVFL